MLTPGAGKWTGIIGMPDLKPEAVYVCAAALDAPREVLSRSAEILSADERERADRFRFYRDKRRFIVARAALREILGSCMHADPRSLSFRYGRFGKPALGGKHENRPIRFSVSHSHELALISVAYGREVGIDLEYVRPVDDLESMAARSFSIADREALGSLRGKERLDAFFVAWTRREAFLKAVGEGLSFPMGGFDFVTVPGEMTKRVAIHGEPSDETRWTLADLQTHPAYASAIVAEGEGWHLEHGAWPAERIAG